MEINYKDAPRLSIQNIQGNRAVYIIQRGEQMNEITTFCPNCQSPVFFFCPLNNAERDNVAIKCNECGLRMYGRNRALKWENKIARYLSRGIAPKVDW